MEIVVKGDWNALTAISQIYKIPFRRYFDHDVMSTESRYILNISSNLDLIGRR